MVVDEAEEIGLATRNNRPVQGVTGPQIPGGGGLEATKGLRRRPVGAGVEPETGEVPLQRALGGSSPLGSADDLGHLGRRAPGHLTFERLGQVQQLLLGHRLAGARGRGQRLEAAGAIGADPAIEGAAPDAQAPAVRPDVFAPGQLAHERAALADGERLVRRLADERIAEERDVSLRLVHWVEPPQVSVKRRPLPLTRAAPRVSSCWRAGPRR